MADFDLRMDEPSATGADGIVFIINTGDDPTICGAGGGGRATSTATRDTPSCPGFAIVFDPWENSGGPPPERPHPEAGTDPTDDTLAECERG